MSRIKRILNPFFQYGYKIYTSKPRKFRFKDVYTIVQPNVFPPKFTWSTSLLLKHLEEINLENKAKKSSQTSEELVSETLAHIYSEQMLVDQATNAYKKLCLKFPEKSAYFSDCISSLENQINK